MEHTSHQTELRHFAEDVGLMMEQLGQPRMLGRILGWLLVCDPPYQSMKELSQALSASKASISNTTRLLIQIGLIERISLPNYRHDHYRLKSGAWYELTKARIAQIAALRQLAERGLGLIEKDDPQHKARLEEMHTVYTFFEKEFPPLFERLEQMQSPKYKEQV